MPHTKRRRPRRVASAVAVALGATTLAACGSIRRGRRRPSRGRSSLTYWTWAPGMDKVVDLWNKGRQDGPDPGHREASRRRRRRWSPSSSPRHKAGNPPDLVQAEYQALPTLVSNDALADITKQRRAGAKGKFADGVWQQSRSARTRSTRSRRTSAR